ncbi:transporter substrate-binding domain-containing protein [Cytophagaceae bacterium ABcell3]|nr:transporter substrate-binding domain-containing protein [Cytophagaceae bacterium ABcell3]
MINFYRFTKLFLLLAMPLLFTQCAPEPQKETKKQASSEEFVEDAINAPEKPKLTHDFTQIKNDGVLRAIVGYSSTSFFTYKGEPMGYEYELLKKLSDHLGVKLEIVLARNYDEMFTMLNEGKGDIIAFGLTITESRRKFVDFTSWHTTTEQVLVQRKPDNWRDIPVHRTEKQLIRNVLDLTEKEVYVRKKSSYFERLINLGHEIGEPINIKTVPGDMSTEELIRLVNEKEIPCTVADQHIAMLNSTFYRDLDIKTKISFPQRIAWAVRKNSPELLEVVNEWVEKNRGTVTFNVIFNKYFKNNKAFRERAGSMYFSKTGGKISEYDDFIKAAASEINWDWRLLASLIFQESRFDANAESWAGAVGLMQMMPATAKEHGCNDLRNPHESLKAGTSFLKWLLNYWSEIEVEEERVKFVLASYNVGHGHVQDARRLAKKYGADPNVWDDNVAKYLLKKSSEEYYTQDVVRHGYCRCAEPYQYVKAILKRYKIYKELIPA